MTTESISSEQTHEQNPFQRPILIVDQNETECKLLHDSLCEAGYAIITTASMVEAMKLIRRRNPLVVLIDQSMSDMGWLELLSEIQLLPIATPVLMMLEKSDNEIIKSAILGGAIDCLSKPLMIDQVLFKIKVLLKDDMPKLHSTASQRKTIRMSARGMLTVRHVSTQGLQLSGSFAVKNGITLHLEVPHLSGRLGLSALYKFSVYVVKCDGSGNLWKLETRFLNLSPDIQKRLEVVLQNG